jgi:carboxypeptidase family protein
MPASARMALSSPLSQCGAGRGKVGATALLSCAFRRSRRALLAFLFVAVVCLPTLDSPARAWECLEAPRVTTSDVMVQVYEGTGTSPELLQGATVTLLDMRDGRTLATATSDEHGYVRFTGLTPAEYRLSVRLFGFGLFERRVRVVRASEAPARLIAVALTVMCPRTCSILTTGGPFKKAPRCL